MANWLGNSEHVYGDHPPTLEAGNLGSLVSAILSNKLERDKMTQQSILNTIKNIQQQRASGEYLDAARQADVIPPDAMSGLDSPYAAAYGTKLADQIREKQSDQSQSDYRKALADRMNKGVNGGDGSGSGSGGGSDGPDISWVNGVAWYQRKGQWYRVPGQMTDPSSAAGESRNNAELARLLQHQNDLEAIQRSEEATNRAIPNGAGANRPFSREKDYNWTVQRIRELQGQGTSQQPPPVQPPPPSTAPTPSGGSATPGPSGTPSASVTPAPSATPRPPVTSKQYSTVPTNLPPGGGTGRISPQSVQLLLDHANDPQYRKWFDEFYGPGSSNQFLPGGGNG